MDLFQVRIDDCNDSESTSVKTETKSVEYDNDDDFKSSDNKFSALIKWLNSSGDQGESLSNVPKEETQPDDTDVVSDHNCESSKNEGKKLTNQFLEFLEPPDSGNRDWRSAEKC